MEKAALGFDSLWPWRYVLSVYGKCAAFLRADYGVDVDGDRRVRRWRDCLGSEAYASPQVETDAPLLTETALGPLTIDFAERRSGRGLRLVDVPNVSVGALLVVASALGDSTLADGNATERFELCHGYPTDGNRHQPRICFTASNAGDPPMRALWGATRSTGARHVYTVVFGHKSWKRAKRSTTTSTARRLRWGTGATALNNDTGLPTTANGNGAAAAGPFAALRGNRPLSASLARRVPFLLRSNSLETTSQATSQPVPQPRSRARRVPTPPSSSSNLGPRVVSLLAASSNRIRHRTAPITDLSNDATSLSTNSQTSDDDDIVIDHVHNLDDDDDDDEEATDDDDDEHHPTDDDDDEDEDDGEQTEGEESPLPRQTRSNAELHEDDLNDDDDDEDETQLDIADEEEEPRSSRAAAVESPTKRSAALFIDSTIEGCADVGPNVVASGLTVGSDRNGAYRLRGDVAVFALWKGHTPASCLMALEKALIRKYGIDAHTKAQSSPKTPGRRPRSGTA